MLKGLFILTTDNYARIYNEVTIKAIQQHVELVAPQQTPTSIRENMALLESVEVIFSGWGAPVLDAGFLAAAPNLKAFFYGAGSVRGIATDAFWDTGILITSAASANAVPVAEFTLAQIILGLKQTWRAAWTIKTEHRPLSNFGHPMIGAYGSTVGLISLGMIGRLVAQHLRHFDINVIAYDPFVSAGDAAQLGVELCDLDEVFRRADVISLHTPWLESTEGMITGAHFRLMKPNTTFINTARGAIVREDEMIAVLQERPDIAALLDVTHPEPPVEGSPLYTLPNVMLTPHIAGSMAQECHRMGHYMLEELERYITGQPLRYQITRQQFEHMA